MNTIPKNDTLNLKEVWLFYFAPMFMVMAVFFILASFGLEDRLDPTILLLVSLGVPYLFMLVIDIYNRAKGLPNKSFSVGWTMGLFVGSVLSFMFGSGGGEGSLMVFPAWVVIGVFLPIFITPIKKNQ